jgi:hypothetical protein
MPFFIHWSNANIYTLNQKQYDEIFGNIYIYIYLYIYHLFEMESSKIINYSTKMCQSGRGTYYDTIR